MITGISEGALPNKRVALWKAIREGMLFFCPLPSRFNLAVGPIFTVAKEVTQATGQKKADYVALEGAASSFDFRWSKRGETVPNLEQNGTRVDDEAIGTRCFLLPPYLWILAL